MIRRSLNCKLHVQRTPFVFDFATNLNRVYTAGMALYFLGVCYYLNDMKGYKGWTKPFLVYGMNAITVFVLSGMVGRLLILWKVGGTPAKTWIYQNLFLSWAGPLNG